VEAQVLASRGELTATTTVELQDSFNAYAASALADAGQTQSATTTATTDATSTTTIVETKALRTPAHMLMIPAEASTSTATSTATSTNTNDTANDKEGFASQLKVSLDAQASILNTLQVQMGLHREDQQGDDNATSTTEQGRPRTYPHNKEKQ
jgi:hypothetical protein